MQVYNPQEQNDISRHRQCSVDEVILLTYVHTEGIGLAITSAIPGTTKG